MLIAGEIAAEVRMGVRIEMLEFIQCVLAKVLTQHDKAIQPCLINKTGFYSAVYQSDPALMLQQLSELIQQALVSANYQLVLIVSEKNKHLELEIYSDDSEQIASKCTTPEKAFYSQAVCVPEPMIMVQSLAKIESILPSLISHSSLNLSHSNQHAAIHILILDGAEESLNSPMDSDKVTQLTLCNITDNSVNDKGQESALYWPFYDTDIINMINNETDKAALNILVADDSMPSLIATKAMLEKLGCNVMPASDGNAALALAQQYAFDLLFLDERMPGLNGSDVAQTLIEQDGKNQLTPKVSLTGLTDPDEIAHLFSKGITHYLEKPVTKLALEKFLVQWQG